MCKLSTVCVEVCVIVCECWACCVFGGVVSSGKYGIILQLENRRIGGIKCAILFGCVNVKYVYEGDAGLDVALMVVCDLDREG